MPRTLTLTDSPEAGDWLLGRQAWRRVGLGELEGADARLWGALARDRPAWTADLPARPGWARLLVMNRADGSQFDALQELGDAINAGGPTACVARGGSGFHGLRKRKWEALEGNIHLSVALPMDTPISALGPGLSMLPAVAVVDAIRGSSGGAIVPGIKWVNDLLVEGRKVAGVLTATRIQGATVQLVVMGAGINLERAPALEWTPFVPEADCLGRLPGGESISPADLLSQLLNALARRLSALIEAGPGELLQAYRHNSLVLGRRVMIWQEGSGPPAPPSHRGIVESIGEDLSLHLRGGGPAVTSGRLAYASVMKARP